MPPEHTEPSHGPSPSCDPRASAVRDGRTAPPSSPARIAHLFRDSLRRGERHPLLPLILAYRGAELE